ncbi:response regulator [Roseivivax isoporae]|uniref:Response regulator n=1 Tax=Roseivivax isoporae LMG 25204 TaxID=1449351 RepID=X7F6H1_9RHOB|nr:response regulator [Roseivivax isoporae]ETX27686.1 response regulator [Roseivivax isoporae LMG 25204]
MTGVHELETALRPTATRPLLGLTVLVVEDSRYACDALRLMCLRSGARIRRADSLAAARRHLQVYRPSAAVIDLGLPDGSGTELIAELSLCSPRVRVILATSGDPSTEASALAAGADSFLSKPVGSVWAFQSAILTHLPSEWRPRGGCAVSTDPIPGDPVAYRDDLAHAAQVLEAAQEPAALDYVARFVSGVARCAGDPALTAAADALSDALALGEPVAPARDRIARLLRDGSTARLAV